MGCASSKNGDDVNVIFTGLTTEVSSAEAGSAEIRSDDPRWDDAGFREATGYEKDGEHAFAWLKVGYAREVARAGGVLGARQELPPRALHCGAPPPEAQLFCTNFYWHSPWMPDPFGEQLRELVGILDREKTHDEDLICFDWCSLFQSRHSDYTEPGRTELQNDLFGHALEHLATLYVYARIRTIVLPRVATRKPPRWDEYRDGLLGEWMPVPHIDKGWPMFELFMAAYTQRILYAQGEGNEDVEAIIRTGLDPARLADPRTLFLETVKFVGKKDAPHVLQLIAETLGRMPPVPRDDLGFRCFCERSQLAWLRVRLVREWARKPGFPFPRRQELPAGSFVVGAPPAGARKFVVSHGWESEMHPSPSGGKMLRLADALLTLEAVDDDLVFFDFCSNSQAAKMGRIWQKDEPWPGAPLRDGTCGPYFEANGVSFPLADRTREQTKAFGYAMWDMGRLYAFHECEVIVLPELDSLNTFPGGDVWGMLNSRPYQNRGWCCAEFGIARYCGTIANPHDPAVQRVLKSREWPAGGTADACRMYAEMMVLSCDLADAGKDGLTYDAAKGVNFTSKGDRAAVKYNFFKMTMSKESLGL